MASPNAPSAATPASMRTALSALLDSVPGSRAVLRHLAAVEQRQLEGLIDKAPPPGLGALRLRLADSIRDREHAEELAAWRQPVSSFFVDHKLQVSEGGLTDFDRLSAEWSGVAGAKPPKTP